jgi:hypothetical protein
VADLAAGRAYLDGPGEGEGGSGDGSHGEAAGTKSVRAMDRGVGWLGWGGKVGGLELGGGGSELPTFMRGAVMAHREYRRRGPRGPACLPATSVRPPLAPPRSCWAAVCYFFCASCWAEQ